MKNSKTVTQALILSSLLSVGGWAYAADDAAVPPATDKAAVSAAAGTRAGTLFAQADKNKDGKLDSTEFAELQKLHDAEMAKRQAERPDFKTLDANGDGYVTHDEMRAAMKSHMGDRQQMHGGMHGGKHGQNGDSLFAQADANHDGTLSEAEYKQFLKLRQERQARMNAATPDFKTLDTNGDGQISHDELRAAMQKMRQQTAPAK